MSDLPEIVTTALRLLEEMRSERRISSLEQFALTDAMVKKIPCGHPGSGGSRLVMLGSIDAPNSPSVSKE
jgi:hypothetical protein